MIERILPPNVICVSTRGDDPDAYLLPEEVPLLGRSVENRAREMTTARHCARRALQQLGLPETPILQGPKREPLWPEGIVGSITHCRGYRAAAVARAAGIAALGIDAEPHQPLPPGVAGKVLDLHERGWLARAPAAICWDRLIFSAKEAVYKAWFPLTQKWLGFEDATVTVDPRAGTFQARLRTKPTEPREFNGRFLIREGLVLTAIAVPNRGDRR